MAHDHNGRVGPPRCQECNAPLTSDERRLDTVDSRFLCLECQLALNPLQYAERGVLALLRTQPPRRNF